MSERDGFNRALRNAVAAQVAAIWVDNHGMLAETRYLKREYLFGTGRHAAAATAASSGNDHRNGSQAGYSPRSICFHVNSGFACVREKG